MSDVKRFDCTSGGAQFCEGCYTMERDDENGDYVLFEDYKNLRSENARLQAWHDAVIGQSVAAVRTDKNIATVGGINDVDFVFRQYVQSGTELIIRPKPLTKE